jgi:broad specificity phosphatase PhoE
MIEIIFVRHGESVGNKEDRFRGRFDFPLNENGIQQAQLLREELKSYHFAKIYSSPLSRALKTAEILADNKLPVKIEEGLTNISLGKWENKPKREIRDKYPELWRLWLSQPERLSFEGMETISQVKKRAYKTLLNLIRNKNNITIGVVTHRAVIKPLFAAILGMPEPYFWKIHMDTGAYSIADYRKERGFTFLG